MNDPFIERRFSVRQCRTNEEFQSCIVLQRRVWQFSDLDIIPLRAFVINLHSGGMTHGAFDEQDQLVGFAHALPAFGADLSPFYYSHMLAVEPSWRDMGIGWRLKMEQREHALQTGVPLIRWTFDPLQSRNANLNIRKLGGVVREYKVNYYGNSSTSALHRGLDTDRLFVEWWVGSPRVTRTLLGKTVEPGLALSSVTIPWDIERLKAVDLEQARSSQIETRTAFLEQLARGNYCAGFEATPGEGSRYLFYEDRHEEESRERIEKADRGRSTDDEEEK
jgi:predicted GNAT superfamily acetyltransferase